MFCLFNVFNDGLGVKWDITLADAGPQWTPSFSSFGSHFTLLSVSRPPARSCCGSAYPQALWKKFLQRKVQLLYQCCTKVQLYSRYDVPFIHGNWSWQTMSQDQISDFVALSKASIIFSGQACSSSTPRAEHFSWLCYSQVVYRFFFFEYLFQYFTRKSTVLLIWGKLCITERESLLKKSSHMCTALHLFPYISACVILLRGIFKSGSVFLLLQ